jgi:hypothetical protein
MLLDGKVCSDKMKRLGLEHLSVSGLLELVRVCYYIPAAIEFGSCGLAW